MESATICDWMWSCLAINTIFQPERGGSDGGMERGRQAGREGGDGERTRATQRLSPSSSYTETACHVHTPKMAAKQ